MSLTLEDSLIEETIEAWRQGLASADGENSPAGPLFVRDLSVVPTGTGPTHTRTTTAPTTLITCPPCIPTTATAYTEPLLFV